MRVLMLIPESFYSARGTPLSAYHRTRDLTELGCEVDILTYPVGETPPDLNANVYRSVGPHFVRNIKQGPSYLKIWFDALIIINLFWRLMRRRYDLIYAHEEGGFIAALLTPIFKIPLVYDMHSSLPLQIRDWKFSRREWVVNLFGWVERFTLRRALAAIAISPGVAEAAKQAVPDANVLTIVNRFTVDEKGTPEDARKIRDELGLKPKQKMVLYTGSFVALQALDLLVEAIPAVAVRVPDVRFVLVGGRDEEIRNIEALAERIGASANLMLLALRPQSHMPAFVAASDVLVSPRVEGINPPGKLFSYMDADRPVVATDCAIHNQILDHDCAILTPPSAEGLAQGILTAILDEQVVARVKAGAKKLLQTKYSPQIREETYKKLFELIKSAPV